MIDIPSLPMGHWVGIHHGGLHGVAAWDDPVVKHWHKVRDGKPSERDVAAVTAWLERQQPAGQLPLWDEAA